VLSRGLPDDSGRLEPLLDRVLDAEPAHRARILGEVSGGDEARRAELEALLRDGERSVPLLDRPAAERFSTLLEDEPVRFPPALEERYRPVRELGRGGMATVFLARDTKHERDIAVKIMRSELTASLGRPRFLREIGIAAGLRHPHIVPLFDSGEANGALYYIMPYEPGHSLRERLREQGRLPVDEVVSILRDVCDALAYAHGQGVVHRDIKPDNILLSGPHAMVTDFGVARAVTVASEQDPHTGGILAGTPAYMPPESVSRDAPVDPRADIYALGVTAFEMLAGERPGGRSLPDLRPEVPPGLAALVARCMAAAPADRFATAGEVIAALETSGVPRHRPTRGLRDWLVPSVAIIAAVLIGGLLWSRRPPPRGASSSGPPRLAVLPFQAGADPELQPLALGLTDNLIGALGAVPGLEGRSLNAVQPFRDSSPPPDVVGRRLDVSWLVAGRLYRLGPEIVASVELTEAASGRLLARSESRAASGAGLELIQDVVPAVATMLRERLGEEVRVQGWRAGTRSDEAFAAVNRAHQEREDANRLAALRDIPGAWLGFRRADALLEGAARADPEWPEPVMQRALVSLNAARMLFGSGQLADSLRPVLMRGTVHAEAALALAPEDPRAGEILGLVLIAAAQFLPVDDSTATRRARAEQLLEQASRADTTMVDALTALSSIHFSRGRFEQAYVSAERAYRADAYHSDPQVVLGRLFTYSFEAEEDAEAARWCAEYGRRFDEDWFGGYCRLTLMVWDSTTPANSDTAARIADVSSGLAPRVIRPAVSAQLRTLAAGVTARAGAPAAARRVLAEVRVAAAADPVVTREPFGSDLRELTAAVQIRLGDTVSAARLVRELLARFPERAARMAPGRRFRGLAVDELARTAN